MLKRISVIFTIIMLLGSSASSYASTGNRTEESVKYYRVKKQVEIVPYSGTYNPLERGLRIRKEPGLKGKVIGYLYPGDWVTIGHGDNVYKDGYTWGYATKQSNVSVSGWVAMEYLEEIG